MPHPATTEESAKDQVEQLSKTRTLFAISDALEKLSDSLDECGDDAQQNELINN